MIDLLYMMMVYGAGMFITCFGLKVLARLFLAS